MENIKEKHVEEWFEEFMEKRGFKNVTELADYIIYLEDVKNDHEVLKDKIANLNRQAKEMY